MAGTDRLQGRTAAPAMAMGGLPVQQGACVRVQSGLQRRQRQCGSAQMNALHAGHVRIVQTQREPAATLVQRQEIRVLRQLCSEFVATRQPQVLRAGGGNRVVIVIDQQYPGFGPEPAQCGDVVTQMIGTIRRRIGKGVIWQLRAHFTRQLCQGRACACGDVQDAHLSPEAECRSDLMQRTNCRSRRWSWRSDCGW